MELFKKRSLDTPDSRLSRFTTPPGWLTLTQGVIFILILAPFGLGCLRGIRMMWANPSGPVIPSQIEEGVVRINRELQANESIFVVCAECDLWFSRLWQRALYPRPVFIIQTEAELHGPRMNTLRTKYAIQYALSIGKRPLDPRVIAPYVNTVIDFTNGSKRG